LADRRYSWKGIAAVSESVVVVGGVVVLILVKYCSEVPA
jgi:hypothetical protein